jgi:hypothetical protein
MRDPGGGIDWSVYSEDGLTKIFFGHLYRSRHSIGDRRAPGEMPMESDYQLGIPTSEAKLVRGGNVKSGIEVALSNRFDPQKFASNLILTGPGEVPGVSAGTAYARVPRDKWPRVAVQVISELTYRWQRWALMAAGKGWVELKYPVVWEATDGSGKRFESSIGKDGLPQAWHATHVALEVAEERVPTEWPEMMRGPRNALATASQADREYAAKVAPWYYDEWKNEEGAGT